LLPVKKCRKVPSGDGRVLNASIVGRSLSLALFVLAMPACARAAEPYEGAWVTSMKHCSEKEDGPNSLTVIDLKANIDGKPRAMVEQYENHCFIDKKATTGSDTAMTATCYEFWGDFKKKVNGRKETIKLSLASKDLLKIDGKQYRRCPEKPASSKASKDAKPAKR
jgi:hypothetical protein